MSTPTDRSAGAEDGRELADTAVRVCPARALYLRCRAAPAQGWQAGQVPDRLSVRM